MKIRKITAIIAVAMATTGIMTSVGFTQSTPKSATVLKHANSPFDLKLWQTHYRNGRKYYKCEPPRCTPSVFASYFFEKVQGDLDSAFDQEIKNQRAISTIPRRQLLSFNIVKQPQSSGLGNNRSTLAMSWRDDGGAAAATFGFLRIVYESNTKIFVLVPSNNLNSGRKTETAISAHLNIFP